MLHPTAIIHPEAQIDPSADIGPYVIIDGPAIISERCRIEAHAQIIGRVHLAPDCVIGRAAIIGAAPQDLGFDPATISGVEIGPRTVVREHVTIHRGSKPDSLTRLGSDNFLMVGCHLGHDVTLGSHNIIANAALLAGHVHVGDRTFIGGGAVFHQRLLRHPGQRLLQQRHPPLLLRPTHQSHHRPQHHRPPQARLHQPGQSRT